MSEQSQKETRGTGGFKQKLAESIKIGDVDDLMTLLVEIDELLLKDRILESTYRRPSVAQQDLKRGLAAFIQEAGTGSTSYLFALTGGNDRIRILVEQEGLIIEPTQNCSAEVRTRWDEIK